MSEPNGPERAAETNGGQQSAHDNHNLPTNNRATSDLHRNDHKVKV